MSCLEGDYSIYIKVTYTEHKKRGARTPLLI